MKKKIFIGFGLVLFVLFNCKDNSVEPIEPGSSNYSWINDSLDVEIGHSISRIWASSSNEAWACGQGEVWHYNGNKWLKDNSVPGWGYGALGGADKYNVWMVANGNYNGVDIFKYNGSAWNKYGHYAYSKIESYLWLNDVWGNSANNIYGVGAIENKRFTKNIGIVMKYDGYNWKILDLPEIDVNFYGIKGDKNGKYYIYGEQIVRDTTTNPITITDFVTKIYEFDGNNIREIFSDTSQDLYPTVINGSVYFVGEKTVQKYSHGYFSKVYDFSNSEYNVGNGVGRNAKDLILWCVKGVDYWGPKFLVHYNGSELKPIFSTDNIYGLELEDDCIFVITRTSNYKWEISKGSLSNGTPYNPQFKATAFDNYNLINGNKFGFSKRVIRSRLIDKENIILNK